MGRILLILLGVALLAAVVIAATFPLATAIGLSGAPVEGQASGTIWNGQVDDAEVEGTELGTVEVRTHLRPLLSGTLRADLTVDGPSGKGAGLVERRGEGVLIRDAAGTIDLASLGGAGPFGLPMAGEAAVTATDLVLTPAGCAGGAVTASSGFLREAARSYGGEGFDLSGDGVCRDGVIVLPMRGQGGEGAADLLLRITPGPRTTYVSDFSFRPADPRLGGALRAVGFREAAGSYSLVTRGAF